jgi:hypothetical protein
MDEKPRHSRVAWQDEHGKWHDYPKEWYGTWLRPGEPHGVPSFEAKVNAWRVLLDILAKKDMEAAKERMEAERQAAFAAGG